MRIVFAGTPDVAVPSLQALMNSHHDVVAVITRPDAPVGRGRKLTPSPVAVAAEAAGVPVYKPDTPNSEVFLATLKDLAPDICPVVAYGALLKEQALAIPPLGWVNLHFSLLPRWRGAAPVQHAIMAGDTVTGTTCFRIVKALDAGDIIRSASIPMPDETAGELLQRLADSGAQQLLDSVDALASGEAPTPQPGEGVTYAAKLTTATARLDFSRDAQTLRNQIMGCSPDPGAWCELDGQRFKVFRARISDADALPPGELVVTKRNVFVGTGDLPLQLEEVQAPGKKRMKAIDWARGGAHGKVLS